MPFEYSKRVLFVSDDGEVLIQIAIVNPHVVYKLALLFHIF